MSTSAKVILLGICGVAFVILVSMIPSTSANHPVASPVDSAAEKLRSQRLTTAAVGAASIKRAMRDPDSFKLSSVLIIDKTGAACYEYRARNGFNGINVGQAVMNAKGIIKTNEMSGFSGMWNHECAHKQGTENADGVSMLMRFVPNE